MAPVSVTNPRPIVICGPSGTGKSTLLKRLFAEYPDHFGFSVSHTTRGPRPGEVDGKEYHFTNRLAMQGDIDAGKFIEHAEFAGNMYGTSYSAVQTVLAAMKHVILDIDVQGVQQLQAAVKGGKETGWKTAPLYIFIAPPNEAELENRLKGRGTENDESLGKRLGAAKKELEWGTTSGNVDTVVTNDVVDKAYEDLKKAIFQAQ
ncbi:P-loop containing nucleoside triphosphate hydrolase protein [Phlyctochytrium arcticum]|nr:P-loop containing nucleoside triphosphate hydrolase protein [Phlyctochytrium arcticum]